MFGGYMNESVNWPDILPVSGVMGILGKRREGKSALAYHIAELRHQAQATPACVLGPPPSLAEKFPEWMTIVTALQDFQDFPGHTAILDEGSLPLHARHSLSRDHTGFDQLLSLCGQLDQLFIFCTHHSRKLDINIVTEYEVLAFKFPNKMHTRMERPEIREWSTAARTRLSDFDAQGRKEWSFVLHDDLDETAMVQNPLPTFWCDEISKAVSSAITQKPALDEVAELDEIRRDLSQASLEVWDSDPEVRVRV